MSFCHDFSTGGALSQQRVEAWLATVGHARGTEVDKNALLWGTSPAPEDFCPRKVLIVRKATGTIEEIIRFCGSWRCEKCAPRRARATIAAVARYLWPQVWYHAPFEWDEKVADRIRQRAARAPRPAGTEVGYFWVRRLVATETFLFANCPFVGKEPPSDAYPVSPHEALILVRQALAIPGVERVGSSHSWPLLQGRDRGHGTSWNFGPVSQATLDAFWPIIQEKSERLWGVTILPGVEPPPCVSPEAMKALVEQALVQARSRRVSVGGDVTDFA